MTYACVAITYACVTMIYVGVVITYVCVVMAYVCGYDLCGCVMAYVAWLEIISQWCSSG